MTTEQETIEDDDKYEDMIRREQELKDQINESRHDFETDVEDTDKLNLSSYLTGLIGGEVVDIDYIDNSEGLLSRDNNKVVLHVQSDEGFYKVPVEDNGEYSEDNEIVRLLHWKGITEGRIGDLIGENVNLELSDNPYSRDYDVDSDDLRVYIPDKVDFFGKGWFRTDHLFRWLGFSSITQSLKGEPTGAKSMFSTMFVCLGVAMYLLYSIIVFPTFSIITESLIIPFLFTLALILGSGIQLKFLTEIESIYKSYRRKDSIRE